VPITTDICFNKPVTNEVPYWLLREYYLRHMLFETRHNIFPPLQLHALHHHIQQVFNNLAIHLADISTVPTNICGTRMVQLEF
jgi:hypothetical protein